MKKTLLITMTLLISTIGYSQTFTDNFITYNITTSNTVEASDYDFINGGATVNIPATVDYNSATYNVTSVGANAFQGNVTSGEQITNVTIPSSVTNIGDFAFSYNQLTSVSIPNSVTSINFGAFNSNLITNLIIGNNVASIGNNAFSINQLSSVTIPTSVTSIGNLVFASNSQLTCVISEGTTPPTLASGSSDPFFNFRSNIDLSIPTGTATAYAAAQWTGFNSVAEGLTGTFVVDYITYQINATPNNEVSVTGYNTAGGTVVDIPATVVSGCTTFSVVTIGVNAFSNDSLTNVTIPSSVTSIGVNAFRNNNLISVTILDNVTSIGDSAFRDNSLISVTIPGSITDISDFAFYGNQLTTLSILNGVTTIGIAAFSGSQLTSITIPDSVTSIGDNAFAFNELSNVVIPNSVLTIGQVAFFTNQLTSVTIPASVTSIGFWAFHSNPLTDVISLATTPPVIATIGISGSTNDTFSVRSTIHLHIPGGTMGAYVNDAGALWTGFNPVTQDALGVSDFEFANDIKVITTTDEIKVIHSNNVSLQSYVVYTIFGAKVSTGTENEIPTTYLASGVYILKLDFDKGAVTKKVVVH